MSCLLRVGAPHCCAPCPEDPLDRIPSFRTCLRQAGAAGNPSSVSSRPPRLLPSLCRGGFTPPAFSAVGAPHCCAPCPQDPLDRIPSFRTCLRRAGAVRNPCSIPAARLPIPFRKVSTFQGTPLAFSCPLRGEVRAPKVPWGVELRRPSGILAGWCSRIFGDKLRSSSGALLHEIVTRETRASSKRQCLRCRPRANLLSRKFSANMDVARNLPEPFLHHHGDSVPIRHSTSSPRTSVETHGAFTFAFSSICFFYRFH